jgi:tetratricopeptide (TPR) repeat protein
MIPPAVTEDIASLEGDMVMIGSIIPHRLDYSLVNRLLGVQAVREDLKKIAVDDALSLLCNRVMDGRDMLRFAGDAPLNTDDAPRIELDAPRGLYLDKNKKTALEFSIHHSLASAGRAMIPPLENFPQLAKANDRERASLYHRIGRLYRQKVLVDKAYRLLTESVSLAPDSAGALLDLAQLFYSMGQSREAELAVIRSISLDPAPPEAYNLLATIYLNSGRLENAKDIASRLIDIHPGGHWGYWCLALVYLQKGEYAEARKNLVKVLQLIPDHEAARKYLASLDAKATVR